MFLSWTEQSGEIATLPRRKPVATAIYSGLDWQPPMRYAQYAPSRRFAAIVECYWFLEGDGPAGAEPIIPDGRMEVVLHYGRRFDRHHADGRVERQDAAMLVGQLLAPVTLASRGSAGVAAIRLRPAAGRAIADYTAAELAGRFIDLDALFGSTDGLRDRLAVASGDAARVALLESWLAPHVRREPSVALTVAVNSILDSPSGADLATVASQAGIGLRQLERQFIADVGISPKTFARMARLQAALSLIASGQPLGDVAVACGYYDQSHMTRDFMHLAQTSPAAWRQQSGVLTPLFVNA
jgi:AraC-like DNA-binding protein